MSQEDPWDAPDPTKLRITSAPASRKLDRPPTRPAPEPGAPPPHHASPTPEHGVIDEAAVEAPPIPRPEQPRSPRPAVIDTRVSQGQTPPVAMVDGLSGASWRGVDEAPGAPKPPPIRPWARNAGISIGVLATLVIFGTVIYVLGIGAARAIQETDPDRSSPVPMPGARATEAPRTFRNSPETSIVREGEVPPAPLELPPEVDPYDGAELDPTAPSDDVSSSRP